MSDSRDGWREFNDGIVERKELWIDGGHVATFRRLMKTVVISEEFTDIYPTTDRSDA